MNSGAAPNPPVVEMLLTVQFSPPLLNLNLLNIAELAGALKEQYPLFNQVDRAGPMSPFHGQPAAFIASNMPRIMLLSEDLSFRVYFQDDRLSVGWNRVVGLSDPANYPGFDEIFTRFESTVSILQEFVQRHGFDIVGPVVGELVYVDQFVVSDNGTDISQYFSFLDPTLTLSMSSMNYTMVSPHEASVGFTEAGVYGPFQLPTGEFVFGLQTTVRFGINEHGWDDLKGPFQEARQHANDTFQALVREKFRSTSC